MPWPCSWMNINIQTNIHNEARKQGYKGLKACIFSCWCSFLLFFSEVAFVLSNIVQEKGSPVTHAYGPGWMNANHALLGFACKRWNIIQKNHKSLCTHTHTHARMQMRSWSWALSLITWILSLPTPWNREMWLHAVIQYKCAYVYLCSTNHVDWLFSIWWLCPG